MRRENNYGPFDGSNASKSQDRRVHVRAWCSIYYGWLRPNDRAAGALKHTLTCCVMRAGTRSLTGATTRGRCRRTSVKNIQHTVRYTELSPTRFKNFWRE